MRRDRDQVEWFLDDRFENSESILRILIRDKIYVGIKFSNLVKRIF